MTQPSNTANGGAVPNNPSIDFVDFYQVLETEQEATTTHLRRRINDLYSEAQSNRDHRNVAKRRRYEALCELLPYCRIVLLDPDKRARYDRYLEQARSGSGVPDFETIMEEIAGSIGDGSGEGTEKIGLPGIQGDDDLLPVADEAVASKNGKAHTLAEKSATASNAKSVAPTVDNSVTLTQTRKKPARRKVAMPAADSLAGSAISVFVFSAIFGLIWFFRHTSPDFTLGDAVWPAAVAGLIVWIVSHLRGGTPIR